MFLPCYPPYQVLRGIGESYAVCIRTPVIIILLILQAPANPAGNPYLFVVNPIYVLSSTASMLFNSLSYACFLPIALALYWLLRGSLSLQNILLLSASYFFYACWDWRFLFLLIFSTLLDFYSGIKIHSVHTRRSKLTWLWISITINLGFLAVFKYYNFFATSLQDALQLAGIRSSPSLLKVILPVGISFYTFHGLSYVIDIYKGRLAPERRLVDYSVFVSFFPLLVAGPIERATHLLPQIKKARRFDFQQAADGLRQILWGLFKKVVIADTCAELVNKIFGHYQGYHGSTLVVGAILFAFQIYCDFSGYSDIALGTARLFGIELLRNFAFPYFSRDIAEFWRRWHISLSSWFRDYLYFPLGGSRGTLLQTVKNTFIIFLVSGFWHGANWTFIVWGGLNAVYFMPLLSGERNRANIDMVASGKWLPTLRELTGMVTTFGLTVFAWIFFRADNLRHAFLYIGKIFSRSLFTIPEERPRVLFVLILVFIGIEWLGREGRYALDHLPRRVARPYRWALYYSLAIVIFYFSGAEQQFIYFQF